MWPLLSRLLWLYALRTRPRLILAPLLLAVLATTAASLCPLAYVLARLT